MKADEPRSLRHRSIQNSFGGLAAPQGLRCSLLRSVVINHRSQNTNATRKIRDAKVPHQTRHLSQPLSATQLVPEYNLSSCLISIPKSYRDSSCNVCHLRSQRVCRRLEITQLTKNSLPITRLCGSIPITEPLSLPKW